jgi:hypothetical protein
LIAVLRDREQQSYGREAWSQDRLRTARAEVYDPLFAVPPRPVWLHQLYLAFLHSMPLLLIAVVFGGAIVVWRRWRCNQLSSAVRGVIVWFLILWGLHLVIKPDAQPAAVVRLDGTVLRHGNGLSYPPHGHQGVPIRLAAGVEAVVRTQRANGWVQLELPGGTIGWVPQDAVYLVPGKSGDGSHLN